MNVRDATLSDIERMVQLSEAFRTSLAGYSPVFWAKAEDSFEKQTAWFRSLLPLETTLALVAESAAKLRGFLIGRLQEAPPVYAPGGPVCLIDDFCVSTESDWASVGSQLLRHADEMARERGAVLSVVACPQQCAAKRKFLTDQQFEITTEWHIRNL